MNLRSITYIVLVISISSWFTLLFGEYTIRKLYPYETLKTNPDSGETADWDELVINNFKIKKIHVGEEFAEDFEDDTDIMGIPIMVWDDHEKLSSYFSKINKEMK